MSKQFGKCVTAIFRPEKVVIKCSVIRYIIVHITIDVYIYVRMYEYTHIFF